MTIPPAAPPATAAMGNFFPDVAVVNAGAAVEDELGKDEVGVVETTGLEVFEMLVEGP